MSVVTRTKLIGHFAVDSGQALVGDPGYLFMWKDTEYDPKNNGEYSYNGACGRTLTDESAGELLFEHGGSGAAVVFSTGLGDGFYPVYATYADVPGWGERIVKIEIDFLDNDFWNEED